MEDQSKETGGLGRQLLLLLTCFEGDLSQSWVDALEHRCRRNILRLLNRTPSGRESATAEEISLAVPGGPAVLAYHLRVLAGHKLITAAGLTQGQTRPSPVYCSTVRADRKVALILSATAARDSTADPA
jgi:DNA-binding transcriptional ArsR family regulator